LVLTIISFLALYFKVKEGLHSLRISRRLLDSTTKDRLRNFLAATGLSFIVRLSKVKSLSSKGSGKALKISHLL